MKKINLLPKTFQLLEKIGLPSCSRKCYHLAIAVHLALQKGLQVSDLPSLCEMAAALCHTSPDALEESVREAVEDCWENGRDILEKISRAPVVAASRPDTIHPGSGPPNHPSVTSFPRLA